MAERSSKWRPRTTLANLLLLTAAIAVMLAYYRMHLELERTIASVEEMRSLARQLIVDDPTKIAAIMRQPTIPNEFIVDVHVPTVGTESNPFGLHLALAGIVEHGTLAQRFPAPIDTVPIPPGQHTVEIRHQMADTRDPESQHQVEILLDGEVLMQEKRPPSWMPAKGWTSSGTMTKTTTFDPGEPAVLHRRRFNEPKGKSGSSSVPWDEPANGILLWIE